MDCLTIQNTTEYYSFTKSDADTQSLTEQLQSNVTHQQNAQWLHLMIDNNSRQPLQEPLIITLLETIARLPNLKHVTISASHSRRFPVQALTTLLKTAHNLESLHLHDICLEQQSPYELAELLKAHKTLSNMSLIRCICRPVHVLIQALSRMLHLQKVQLDGTMMSQQHEGEAIHALMALCQSSSLERLELGDLGEVGMVPQLVAMMTAIETAPSDNLKELSLQLAIYETLPMIVINAMARMLTRNHTLERLIVPWMGGAEIWLPVIAALTKNRGLQEFRLHNGDNGVMLSHDFLQRTASVLKDNTHLQYLWYDSWEGKDLEIDLYLRANKFHRGYLLDFSDDDNNKKQQQQHNQATHEVWVQALVASKDYVHVTNYWLSHNPALLMVNNRAKNEHLA